MKNPSRAVPLALALGLGLPSVAAPACVSSPSPSPSPHPDSADLRRCVTGALPFFDNGMQQGRPADGRFAPGTIVRVDDAESARSGNAGVTDEGGHHTFVSGTGLALLPAAACPSAR